LDRASDGFLNENRGEVGFLAAVVVERAACGRVGPNTLRVRVVGSTEFDGTVGTVKKLPGGFAKIVALLVANNESDGRSSPDPHISETVPTILEVL
jgi:hypothetical protein